MQKKLMALAVAGALAVPAVANAQTSSVQISGRAAIEYGRSEQSGRPDFDGTDTPSGSNIRFRGTEALGGGLSAWFQCETSADIRGVDQEGLCGRNSGIGFRGAFGNVFAGKWDTPMKRALGMGSVGAAETGILGMSFMSFGGSGGADVTGEGEGVNRQRWKRREPRQLYYETPNFSGFQLMVSANDGSRATLALDGQSNAKPRLISFGGTYASGPLSIGLGYEKHNEMGALGGATGDLDDKAWGAGVSYTFGPVTVGATYLDADYETSATAETKKQTWSIGLDWRLPGPHMLSFQYVKADDTEGNGGNIGTASGFVQGCATVVNGVAGCGGTGGDAYSLGYTYRFSKRTNIRLGWVRVENDNRSFQYRLGNNGSNLTPGSKQDGYAFLVKHDF